MVVFVVVGVEFDWVVFSTTGTQSLGLQVPLTQLPDWQTS